MPGKNGALLLALRTWPVTVNVVGPPPTSVALWPMTIWTVEPLGMLLKTWVVKTICSAVLTTSKRRLGELREANAAMFCMNTGCQPPVLGSQPLCPSFVTVVPFTSQATTRAISFWVARCPSGQTSSM